MDEAKKKQVAEAMQVLGVPQAKSDTYFNLITLLEGTPKVMEEMLHTEREDDPRWAQIYQQTTYALKNLREIVTLCNQIQRNEPPT